MVPALILASGLIVSTWVDLEWRIIPDEISLGGVMVGLVVSAFIPALHKGPAPEILMTGSAVSFILAGSCMGLHLFKIVRRKIPLEREDKEVFVVALSLLALQWGALIVAQHIPSLTASFAALADAFQGVVIGGCSLWVTGLLGEVVITKRVVTEYDFKGMVDDPKALLADLHSNSYVDGQGNLQPAFREVKAAEDLKLGPVFEVKRKEIFDMLYAVDEGGVMGWGDVKLLAAAGAFLGWQLACVAFFVAPFFGAVAGLFKMLRKQDTAIAYGPFLAIGILVSLYWGDSVIRWVLQMYSIN
jgi:prepilin signal peptidase PulO-like enzyme (type II secretory pathway)